MKLKPGYRTALMDGVLVPDSPQHMATEKFYHALPGSRLHLREKDYLFATAVFSPERMPEFIYTYAYQREENWTTYTRNLTPQTYQEEDYVFDRECYFRVCVRRKDGLTLGQEDFARAGEIIEYTHTEPAHEIQPYFQQEITETVRTILEYEARTVGEGRVVGESCDMREKDREGGEEAEAGSRGLCKLCLLADTHFTVNGTWADTAANIRETAKRVGYDAIVHLGDFTDGMVSKELTGEYVNGMITDLEKCGVPLYITPGNHDSNYFRNRANALDVAEMKALYRLPGEGLDYYVDMPQGLRMVFLSSFEDTAPIRYGYTKEQLAWLKEALFGAPAGTRFLIFSHDGPLAKLDYWSFLIRNGAELLDVLEECNARKEYQIIGFFYGHTHADYCFEECSFPVISVGCAKLEYFTDKKPEGALVYERQAGTVSQDLWDSLLIDFRGQKLKLVRFGAGIDREYSFAKKKSTYREKAWRERAERAVKIWAHRGASGRAPENTMPAFELAWLLGADGIELDVQLTKDGIPVVIHDETVDRVSDGSGPVRNFTLEELRRLNVNKNFPAYGKVGIPTLEEVYAFIKTTDMTVNLELKNSVIFYERLEEKVLALAEKMGISDRMIYSSFNHYSMRRIKELSPQARVAFLYTDGILDIWEYAGKYGAYAVHPHMKNTEYPDMVRKCHREGILVNVWTVNEPEDIKRMKELGVDAVITNYVERG